MAPYLIGMGAGCAVGGCHPGCVLHKRDDTSTLSVCYCRRQAWQHLNIAATQILHKLPLNSSGLNKCAGRTGVLQDSVRQPTFGALQLSLGRTLPPSCTIDALISCRKSSNCNIRCQRHSGAS